MMAARKLLLLLLVMFLSSSSSSSALLSSSSSSSSSSSEMLPNCTALPASLYECSYDCGCRLGAATNLTCRATVPCAGDPLVVRTFACQFCFQTPESVHVCASNASCMPGARRRYIANCTVLPHVLCLGSRVFEKQVACSAVSARSWPVALLLSALLGGFAADRFYLGHVGMGMFKLLSFGGLGVWTVVDLLMVLCRALGPADGAAYAVPNASVFVLF